MDVKFTYDTFNVIQQNKIMLVYQGEFTQEITKSVLAMTERNLNNFNEDLIIKRKVFNVMVECLQNICKHGDTLSTEPKDAIFMIGSDKEHYFITTGNYICESSMPQLKSKLDEINKLDKDGLKVMHKTIVGQAASLSEKGGAGLGLIDVARKSGEKLNYNFTPIQNGCSFYSLLIKISKNKTN
jgi:hypothetical protein